MLSRLFLAVVLSLTLAAPAALPAAAQDTTGLDAIRTTYRLLLELFYRPLEPRDLLHAGWTALGDDADRRGTAAPAPLPPLPAESDAAFDVFAAAYTRYLANLPAGQSPSSAAMNVQSGMAESLSERHTHYLPPAIMQRFLSTVGGGR
jgi:hypothetical protein